MRTVSVWARMGDGPEETEEGMRRECVEAGSADNFFLKIAGKDKEW